MGIRNVKVLDEKTLHQLIAEAVDQVISSQTQEERSKILADSRKQLQKLLAERDKFVSSAQLLEAGKNDLVAQVEKLQAELKLRQQIEDQSEADFKAQLKEIVDRHSGGQQQFKELQDENAWLRAEHDKLIEQVDQLQSEIKRLNEELERLRNATQVADAAVAEQLQSSLAEAASLKQQLAEQKAQAQEIESARQEIETLKEELDSERERANQSEAKAAGPSPEIQEELEDSRREIARLNAELRQQSDATRQAGDEAKAREEELQRALAEAEAHVPATPPAEAAAEEGPPAEEPPPLEEVVPAEVLEEVPPSPPPREPIVLLEKKKGAAPPGGDTGPVRLGKGLDIGTVNLVAAEQNTDGDVELRLRRNAFIDVEITAYTKQMLTRLNVPYVIQGKRMYVLGNEAFELANVLNRNTRRPMKDGLISPKEQDALPVMKLLIGSILGEPRAQGETCFYSVPGEPVDSDLSVAYHRDLFDAVLKALGYGPKHIIEGHAVTFAELADEDFTGIGVSCGGGMFNICVAYKSMPALTFSTARSGDWVDMNVAQALGIKISKAALLKEKGVDLLAPKTREEDAVAIYYRNLIKYNLMNIAERFRAAENMPSFSEPVSIVFSGGTSMAGNFIELVRTVFKELDFPIPIKDVRMAKDPLNATAKGALTAAMLEMAQQSA
jgi:hypothetical protein